MIMISRLENGEWTTFRSRILIEIFYNLWRLDVMIWSEWFDQKNIEQDLKRKNKILQNKKNFVSNYNWENSEER